jgi:hypothetical protein
MFIRYGGSGAEALKDFRKGSPNTERAEEGFYARTDFTVNQNGLAKPGLFESMKGRRIDGYTQADHFARDQSDMTRNFQILRNYLP